MTRGHELTQQESIETIKRAKNREKARLKRMREDVRGRVAQYQKREDDLSALQSAAQIIGRDLKRLDAKRFNEKASSGPRHVVAGEHVSIMISLSRWI